MESKNEANQNECPTECPRLKWVFRLLVLAQFVIGGLIVFLLNSPWSHWLTTVTSFSGVAVGLWAIVTMGTSMNISPELKQRAQLKTSGPYRIVRHPMYLAVMLFCGGFVIASNTVMAWTWLLALLIVLCIKAMYEERMLRARFPEYESYANRTRRIIPFVI